VVIYALSWLNIGCNGAEQWWGSLTKMGGWGGAYMEQNVAGFCCFCPATTSADFC